MSDSRLGGTRILILTLLLSGLVGLLVFPQVLSQVFSRGSFMPHGHCYLWIPGLVGLHVTSDILIWLSYMTISLTIVYIVRKRGDLPFDWIFMSFGIFIIACGFGHLMEVVTLWQPLYWLSGLWKAVTAIASVLTAGLLFVILPKILAIPNPAALREANAKLEAEIAERKRAEAELARTLRLLKDQQAALLRAEKMAAVGQLASSVGHELRNPLAAVRNGVTYIAKRVLDPKATAEKPVDPKVEHFFGLILRELGVCSKIINDLLDFARERAPVLGPCALHALVDESIELIAGGVAGIDNKVSPELSMPIIDRGMFRQVLINLLQNAMDATPSPGGRKVEVTAEGGDPEPWRIVIKDYGAGIPDDLLGKVFEPLFTTKAKGTGLGLAIVQNIVRAHNGKISIDSKVGEGTAITIILPATHEQQAGEGRVS